MFKRFTLGFLIIALVSPAFSLAHEPHPAGAPAHPLGAPDYHPLDTEITPVVTTTNRAALEQQLATLLQLIELLQLQLVLQSGGTVSDSVTSVTNTQSTSGREVEVDTANVTIYTEGGYRYFETQAIPNHDTGTFPNSGNPNTISAQDLEYRVTMNPTYTGTQTSAQLPGIALNGIPMEPGTAEREGNYNIEGLQDSYNLGMDESNAHVQPTGLYHYHGVPEAYLDTLTADARGLIHIGYAADGFKMYHDHSGKYSSGWELIDRRSDGSIPDGTYTQDFEFTGNGTLDECNGAWVSDDEYAYFLTDDFPYISRCLNGTPDASFTKGPGTGGLPPRR